MERPVVDHPGMNVLYELRRTVLLHVHNGKTVHYFAIYTDIRKLY